MMAPAPPPPEPDWRALYTIVHGGASIALYALRVGDIGSAMAALEKAFRELEEVTKDD